MVLNDLKLVQKVKKQTLAEVPGMTPKSILQKQVTKVLLLLPQTESCRIKKKKKIQKHQGPR